MTIREKLETIRQQLNLTQTQLAQKIGVSFVSFNSWWTGKSNPRPKMAGRIEDLFLEITGQKIISPEQLDSKKNFLTQKASSHKNILKEIMTHPDIRDQFILKLTYHSNSIEGSSLTEPDTAAILFDNVALPNKSLTEHLEAKNHQTALNYLFDHLAHKGLIDENLALKLHAILMNGVQSDAGLYRQHNVRIVGVNLPTANYLSVLKLMPTLFSNLVNGDDVINLVARIHSEFERIHPFSDGNGRVGRLLMNGMLLKSNLAPAIIRQEQKRLYYTYLYKAQTTKDHSQLEDYLYDSVVEGFEILERADK